MNVNVEINKLELKILQLEKIGVIEDQLKMLQKHWLTIDALGLNTVDVEKQIGVTERRIENLIKHYNK